MDVCTLLVKNKNCVKKREESPTSRSNEREVLARLVHDKEARQGRDKINT